MNLQNLKLDWRLAMILLFILFSLLYGLFLLFIPKQNQPQTPNAPTPTQSSQNPNLFITTPTTIPMSLFVSNNFTIQHPQEWIAEKNESQDGEKVIFFIENVRENKFFPNLTISVAKDPQIAIDKILIPFLAAGFKQDFYAIDGKSFTRVTGAFPQKDSNNNLLQETNYFLKYSEKIYIIKSRYEGSIKNARLEELFLRIINTIRLL